MLLTTSNLGSVIFQLQKNFPFRISQDPSNNVELARAGMIPTTAEGVRCPKSHLLKLESGRTSPRCQVSCSQAPALYHSDYWKTAPIRARLGSFMHLLTGADPGGALLSAPLPDTVPRAKDMNQTNPSPAHNRHLVG